MSGTDPQNLREYACIAERLSSEFSEVHVAATVVRSVAAARTGVEQVTGEAHPDLVERVAREHLRVLALASSGRDEAPQTIELRKQRASASVSV